MGIEPSVVLVVLSTIETEREVRSEDSRVVNHGFDFRVLLSTLVYYSQLKPTQRYILFVSTADIPLISFLYQYSSELNSIEKKIDDMFLLRKCMHIKESFKNFR